LHRRRFAPRAAIVVAVAAALVATALGLAIALVPWFGGLEQDTLTTRFALRGAGHPRGVVIVAIDDRSFAMLGQRWPFPRSWHGRVLDQLHRAGARGVFYDVQFTEPTTPDQDESLYDALGRTGGGILATTETDGHGHTNVLGGDANLARVHSRAAASVYAVGEGGMIDRLRFAFDGLVTPAVAVAARLDGRLPPRAWFAGDGAYIDYQGPPGTFPTISFADVLRGRFSASAVRGQVVVVGATSPTLQDLHATPTQTHALMSGPEIQANAIWTVLHGAPLRSAPVWLVVVTILLLAVLAPLARLVRSVSAVAVVVPMAAAAYLLAAQLAFDGGVVVAVVGPVAALALSTVSTLLGSHVLVNRELRATQLEIVQRLGRAAECRDGETGRHLERMAFMCERLALAAGLSRREAKLIRRASALHDVGKIAIPDGVLLKRGTFDKHERAVMAQHAVLGARMLSGSSTSLIQVAETIALTHHERWDGRGYPAGLAGAEIPLAGRICAICDVFDALISRRRYKERWSLEATLAELERGAGTHFDPELTALFLRIAPRLYRELIARVDPDIALLAPAQAVTREPSAFHELAGDGQDSTDEPDGPEEELPGPRPLAA
jgi:HD-GYP domain-containing protein (c-di-GMP phosphodiesterase class II)